MYVFIYLYIYILSFFFYSMFITRFFIYYFKILFNYTQSVTLRVLKFPRLIDFLKEIHLEHKSKLSWLHFSML